MSKVKLLVSGLPNIGKTTLLQPLEKVLVFARDGKKYPFEQSHVNIPDFTSAQELIDLMCEKIEKYNEKMDELPETIVIDSISKIFLDIEAHCLATINAYPYGKINTEIKKVVDFIERDLTPTFNVVLVSHALHSEETGGFQIVNAGGSYGKKGGILSEVDEAVTLYLKGNKRMVSYRNPKFASRTTVADLPENEEAENFDLQKHLSMLQEKQSKADEWTL